MYDQIANSSASLLTTRLSVIHGSGLIVCFWFGFCMFFLFTLSSWFGSTNAVDWKTSSHRDVKSPTARCTAWKCAIFEPVRAFDHTAILRP